MDKQPNEPVKSAFKCPLCDTVLAEHPKGSAILFVCPSCDFKILTTKELFPRCFKEKGRWTFVLNPSPHPTVNYQGPNGVKHMNKKPQQPP